MTPLDVVTIAFFTSLLVTSGIVAVVAKLFVLATERKPRRDE